MCGAAIVYQEMCILHLRQKYILWSEIFTEAREVFADILRQSGGGGLVIRFLACRCVLDSTEETRWCRYAPILERHLHTLRR